MKSTVVCVLVNIFALMCSKFVYSEFIKFTIGPILR